MSDLKDDFNAKFKNLTQNSTEVVKKSRMSRLLAPIQKNLIVIFSCAFIILMSTIVLLIVVHVKERKSWYAANYYIFSQIEAKTVITTTQRKKRFQLKVSGIMKELKTDLTDKEIVIYTSFVFDKSEEYCWDPYLPVAVAFVESKFKKKAIGNSRDSGLYQFLPTTARAIAPLAGLHYYHGIEFNVLDSTKLWFAFMRILVDRFVGDLNFAITAYNIGEGNLIYYSKMKIDKISGLLDVESGNLLKLRKFYYKKGHKLSYDEKILQTMAWLKCKGTSEEMPLNNFFKLVEKENNKVKK